MPGVITRLTYQQKNHQRVNVYLDGAFAFALPDAVAARIKIGQHLNDDDIARLRDADTEAKAFARALRLLAARPRSQVEISSHLQRAGFSDDVIGQVSDRLQRAGYLDDDAFVQWWIENRAAFSPRGAQALRQELAQKGVSRDLIDAALLPLDAGAQALAAGRPRAERWSQLPQPDFYQKMLGHLQRRGFDYPTARAAADQLWREHGAGETETNADPLANDP